MCVLFYFSKTFYFVFFKDVFLFKFCFFEDHLKMVFDDRERVHSNRN